jgi:hypothetical protein
MDGVQFVVDESGEKRAVQLDLAMWGDLWEDLYDAMVIRSRSEERSVDWESLRQDLGDDEPRR